MVSRKAVRRSVQPDELPSFTPVPRRAPRHDGWTPARQLAFIKALADTGCVAIAARMVNMSAASAYQLRREPGAEGFRRAWDAAQTLGLLPVKDEAFHRAMHGQLVPVFVGGKLMGFRRKKNDRLLMFVLRHYGQDAEGRKTTVNYFSTRATAAAGAAANPPRDGEGDRPKGGGGGSETSLAAAEASATTVATVISGPAGASTRVEADDEAAAILNAFEGVALDEEAQGEIYRSLAACAERRRALRVDWDTPRDEVLARQAADPECDFIRVKPGSIDYLGELESGAGADDFEPFDEAEPAWESIGEARPQWFVEWERREAAPQAARALPPPVDPPRNGEGDQPPAGGGADAPALEPSPGPEDPAPGPRKRYKARKPKPPFTPPDASEVQARKAEAVAAVEAERRAKAAAEAERRRKRRKDGAAGDGCS